MPPTASAPPTIRVPRRLLRRTCPDNPAERPGFAELVASMKEHGGNLVPIFISKPIKQDGTPPEEWPRDIYEGNARTAAAEMLGLPDLLAIELDKPLSKAELAVFTADLNGVRRLIHPEEWVGLAETVMSETGCSQQEAALRLRLHPTKLSRWMTMMLLPVRHGDAAKLLGPTHRYVIAIESDPAKQDALVRLAVTPGPDGKLPGVDALRAAKKAMNAKKGAGRKARTLKGKFEGREFSIKLREDDAPHLVAEYLKALAAKIAKSGQELPMEAIGFLFAK